MTRIGLSPQFISKLHSFPPLITFSSKEREFHLCSCMPRSNEVLYAPGMLSFDAMQCTAHALETYVRRDRALAWRPLASGQEITCSAPVSSVAESNWVRGRSGSAANAA